MVWPTALNLFVNDIYNDARCVKDGIVPRELVESCDVFVLLLAHRYGARPPGETRSFTELEYAWALDRPDVAEHPLLQHLPER